MSRSSWSSTVYFSLISIFWISRMSRGTVKLLQIVVILHHVQLCVYGLLDCSFSRLAASCSVNSRLRSCLALRSAS